MRYAAVLGVRFSESMLREMLTASGQSRPPASTSAGLGGFVEPEGDGGGSSSTR